MYSVIYVFRLRPWYENTEVCLVPAVLPLPSPTVYACKLGDFYTEGRADRNSKERDTKAKRLQI